MLDEASLWKNRLSLRTFSFDVVVVVVIGIVVNMMETTKVPDKVSFLTCDHLHHQDDDALVVAES